MQLSTRRAALYYYDYVFIKDIRRRQRTTESTQTAGVDESRTHMPGVPVLAQDPRCDLEPPRRPWRALGAKADPRGAETDPQAAHGPPEALRRELGVTGALDVDKSQEHLAGAAYACEVRRKLSRTSTDSALLNR